jgi:hypothetical protein
MTYGLSPRLLVEDQPASYAESAAAGRNAARFRAWRILDEEKRLAAIDEALKAPANDFVDDLPLAL